MHGDLKLRIDLDSGTPAYRQIIDGLRILLVSGELAPGSELPPIRRIALDLGVHFNTVAEAYRILAEEGWLDLRHGRGATVVRRDAPAENARQVEEFSHRLRALTAEMLAKGASSAKLGIQLLALAEELEP
jgi:GntR family transcriptional regulator